jgi:uncharacterized membrane protein (DUF106 family)
MFSPAPTYGIFAALPNFLRDNVPLVLVILVSAIVGLLMVVVFGYTSDQEAIHNVKDQIKAHLLAVRLYEDQLPVVMASYGRILSGTGRYLKLAFKPLLYVILPLVLLIAQLDRYLGFVPLNTGQSFLLKVHTRNPGSLDDVALQLPPGLATTAPAVHVPSNNEIAWRLMAEMDGNYDVSVAAAGQVFSKQAIVSPAVARVSPVRLRGRFWERMLVSSEPALPENGPIQSIEVIYPARTIRFAWLDWNWIWLFFVLSMVAGLFFKSVLGIEI